MKTQQGLNRCKPLGGVRRSTRKMRQTLGMMQEIPTPAHQQLLSLIERVQPDSPADKVHDILQAVQQVTRAQERGLVIEDRIVAWKGKPPCLDWVKERAYCSQGATRGRGFNWTGKGKLIIFTTTEPYDIMKSATYRPQMEALTGDPQQQKRLHREFLDDFAGTWHAVAIYLRQTPGDPSQTREVTVFDPTSRVQGSGAVPAPLKRLRNLTGAAQATSFLTRTMKTGERPQRGWVVRRRNEGEDCLSMVILWIYWVTVCVLDRGGYSVEGCEVGADWESVSCR